MCTFRLKNKNILVTGANGFLGREIVRALTVEGANVIGTDVIDVDSITRLDISNQNDVEKFARNDLVLDGLVNNAAVSFKSDNISVDQFKTTMEVNIMGTYNCITKMKKMFSTDMSIVNIASIYGLISPDFRIYNGNEELYNSSVYGATKAGIIQMTKYYAVQLAPYVRVNAVSPGGIYQCHDKSFQDKYNDRVPLKRMAQTEDVVNSILFLLSPLSSYITGQNIIVDGGMSIL